MDSKTCAQHEETVKELYQDETVAKNYVDRRFEWAWSRLLHEKQVAVVNNVIAEHKITSALELAPGPARLTVHINGLESGVMVEASSEMVDVARERLEAAGRASTWDLRNGNAFELDKIFADGSTFDLAFTFRFIRHFETDERERLYGQIHNRLNPGGFLVFDVVNKPWREKLDAKRKNRPSDALPVYDCTFTEREICRELEDNGFDVIDLHPTIRHMGLQSSFSYRCGKRLPGLAWTTVNVLEKIPSRNPLEWVVVCRRRD